MKLVISSFMQIHTHTQGESVVVKDFSSCFSFLLVHSFCCKDLVKPTAAGLESNNVVLDKTDFCMRCMSLKSLVLNESNLTSEKDYLRLNTFYDVSEIMQIAV